MTTHYTRRHVLRILSVAASATALGLAGCNNSDSNNTDPPVTPQPSGRILAGEQYYPQGIASGDPRATSVILWTRVQGGANAADARVRLQVARDEQFAQLIVDQEFTAALRDDGCLKVRVTNLTAGQRYFYRYLYALTGDFYASRTGRTKTAADPTSTAPVRFAFISCNDYVGRYYNTLLPLLDQDLDFIVHLGDAIYETTGDPSFQGGNAARAVTLRDQAGAIPLGTAQARYFAARSLDNYRELHRTYRADALLRDLYSRAPLIAIWDDHEFSDDCWAANGTYTDGRVNERDDTRRRNAEQAYFEFMPVDLEAGSAQGALAVDPAALYPNTKLYRNFRFGRDVELICTDYRSFRPDHLIPEDAFPGTVVMDRAALTQVLAAAGVPYAAVRSNFSAYLDIDAPAYAPYKQLMLAVATLGYQAAGLEIQQASVKAQEVVRGNLATTVINTFVDQYNAAVPAAQRAPRLPDALVATLDTGIAWFTLGKTSLFGSTGSRYFVVKDTYDLYAAYRAATAGAGTQAAYGAEQDAWLRTRIQNSSAKWKIVATSVSYTSMVLDLTVPALGVPAPFNQRFYLNVDQWDGFPQAKADYLGRVFGASNGVVLLSGDIHAGFATAHAGGRVAEFTTPAVSSSTFRTLLNNAAIADPLLAPLAGTLIPALDPLLRAGSADIKYAQTTRHGTSVAEAGPDAFLVTMYELPEARALASAYGNPASIAAELRQSRFRFTGQSLEVLAAGVATAPESFAA